MPIRERGNQLHYDDTGIDGNSRNTLAGWDDTTSSIEAMRCDNSGVLLVQYQ